MDYILKTIIIRIFLNNTIYEKKIIFTGCNGYQPRFTEPIGNITVPVGREAMFTCYVHGLGGYRVSIFLF